MKTKPNQKKNKNKKFVKSKIFTIKIKKYCSKEKFPFGTNLKTKKEFV